MFLELFLVFVDGRDDASKSVGDVGEVGDASADYQYLKIDANVTAEKKIETRLKILRSNLSVGMRRSAAHQLEDGGGVGRGLTFRGSAAVFAVVG